MSDRSLYPLARSLARLRAERDRSNGEVLAALWGFEDMRDLKKMDPSRLASIIEHVKDVVDTAERICIESSLLQEEEDESEDEDWGE